MAFVELQYFLGLISLKERGHAEKIIYPDLVAGISRHAYAAILEFRSQ